MKLNSALTLFEVLIVIALIGVISLPLYISYTRSQSNQSLRSSSEQLLNTLKSAHISAREAKDKRAWGVKNIDERSYALVSGKQASPRIERITSLESLVTFPEDFEVWFEIGTGNAVEEKTVRLLNSNNLTKDISVSKTGIIDIVQP